MATQTQTTPSCLDDAIKRANQHTHDAIEKPDDQYLYRFLAEFVIACAKDEGHG